MKIKKIISLVLLGLSFSSFAAICPSESDILKVLPNAREGQFLLIPVPEIGNMAIQIRNFPVIPTTLIWEDVIIGGGNVVCEYNQGIVAGPFPPISTVIPIPKATGWTSGNFGSSECRPPRGTRETCSFCISAFGICRP